MAARACSATFSRLAAPSLARRALPRPQTLFKTSATSNGVASCQARSRPISVSAAFQAKKYTEEHEWIELDSDGTTGTIGISTYAAKSLGDVVYVELPQVDSSFEAGDAIGAVESVKAASDILAPVAGTVLEANGMLEEKPGSINKSPEGEAWIAKIKVKDTKELDDLMDKEAYAKFAQED